MQERRPFKQFDPLDKRLSEEGERLRKEARGTPPHPTWSGARQAYSQGATCGNRCPHKRVAFLARSAGSALSQKPPPIIIDISSSNAISGQGAIIVLEMADEDEAIKVAQKLALETGRCITVRDAKMALIETIAAASFH